MEIPSIAQSWIAIAAVVCVFLFLQFSRNASADLVFLTALMAVTAAGLITPTQAFEGFANPGVLTICGLLAVSAALRITGVLDWVGRRLLGRAQTERQAMWRLAIALLVASSFILNTALVAMLMPVVLVWCRRRNVAPSRLLLPLSYLTILGGICTLIGTSTTLVAQAKLRSLRETRQDAVEQMERKGGFPSPWTAKTAQAFIGGLRPMTLFEIGYVGIPCALVGAGFLVVFGKRLLPDRTDILEQLDERRREYLVEMLVFDDCPLVGQTIEQAGLRHLPGLFLIEIDRDGQTLTPIAPDDVLRARDRLVFTGIVTTILDLEKTRGLVPAADTNYEFHPIRRQHRHLTEVVLSRTSPLIGQTIREASFRKLYNAAVVAVHRGGERLTGKIGDIRLQPSDTLLLQTRGEFVSTFRNSRDFYLVSSVDGDEPRLHHKMSLCGVLTLALIGWLIATSFFVEGAETGLMSPPVATISIAILMVLTKCLRISEARGALDIQLLITIGAALGLGRALLESGAADMISRAMLDVVGDRPYGLLIVLYLMTAVFTEAITNNAVAAMLLPLAALMAWNGGYSPRPFVMAVVVAASLSFLTPIGYQTNLMVMGPGGYRPSDYIRCGLPVVLLVGVTALLLIPWIWPFQIAG
ncbi:MAG: SLC13 family permease [Planctomycetes bacterium]|nr:SLC13 family permease [Planctomycetota bacterium]